MAINQKIPHGGWCTVGRKAEDGEIDAAYRLIELPGSGYRQRTRANVRDSGATLIVSIASELSGGSHATAKIGAQLRKPYLHVHPGMDWQSALSKWLCSNVIQVLNVAGPRASKEPGVTAFTHIVLEGLLQHVTGG